MKRVLATILAHELSHVVLGHRVGLQYAFFDQLLVDDKDTFRHFGFARTPDEEAAANRKAIQILNNSPYKNQLGNAGLFLQALDSRQKEIPNLISGHLGNRVPQINDLKSTTPVDPKQNPQKIAALPLGGRVKIDPWNDKLELIKSKPVGTVAEREKMPFEVTPFMPYLMRYGTENAKPVAASTTAPQRCRARGSARSGKALNTVFKYRTDKSPRDSGAFAFSLKMRAGDTRCAVTWTIAIFMKR